MCQLRVLIGSIVGALIGFLIGRYFGNTSILFVIAGTVVGWTLMNYANATIFATRK